MQPVDTITREFRYYYDPRTGTRITSPNGGEPWYVELTAEEYEAAGVLSKPGGYETVAKVMFECGIDVAPPENSEYCIGWCEAEGQGFGDKPLRWHNKAGKWLCREHYEKAAGVAEVEQ